MNGIVKKIVDGYISNRSWRTRENSNAGYSMSGLQGHISGRILAEYGLRFVYPKHIGKAHRQAWIHIHDLSQPLNAYCAGWSIQDILVKGFGNIPGKISAAPAKHFDSILGQLMNFIGTLQNEFAGAQAYNSFDTWLAPFVKEDKLTEKQVKQGLQEFVFGLNQTSRWGNQIPFSNLTFDWKVPSDMKDQKVLVGGKRLGYTYNECQKEMDMINKAFIEVVTDGDADGRIFTFPIPTYNLTNEFDWDSENAKLLFQLTAKFGLPYFQNFINSNLNPTDVRSMCCRLRINTNELETKTGGLFGSGTKTGSLGVVSLNLAKLGYKAKNKKHLFKLLKKYMDISKDSLEIKREVCEKNIKLGLVPWTKEYLGTLRNHFSTIGVVGGHECCLNFIGTGIETEEGIELVKEILTVMREQLVKYQQETKHLYNLEATPAEGTSYRFAKHLQQQYGFKIKLSGTKEIPFLTNSTQLPVDYTNDIVAALEHQNKIQPLYTGGTVFHTFLGERISNWRGCKNLVKKIAENTEIPFFSITPTFSICEEHGYIEGEHFSCPYNKQGEEEKNE